MSELQVPDFRYASDFQNWVTELDDKQIQSWTAKDWNNMYEKLDAFVGNSAEIEDDVARVYPLYKGWEAENILEAKRQKFLDSPMNLACMAKLNSNYCPEKKQIELMRKMADDAAEKLVEEYRKTGVADLADINIPSVRNRDNSVWQDALATMDGIVYDQTQIPDKLYDNGQNINNYRSMIDISDKLDGGGLGGTNYAYRKPVVNFSRESLYGLQTGQHVGWHEFAHAHLQQPKDLGNAGKDILPVEKFGKDLEGFGEDFYKLMKYNNGYYVNMNRVNEVRNSRYSYMLTKRALHGYNGYDKQPMEWFSDYYANRAEHKFRELTGQKSEKSAQCVADFLARDANLRTPDKSFYANGKVNLVYGARGNMDLDAVEKNIRSSFKNARVRLKKNVHVTRTADGINVEVSSKYAIRKDIKRLESVNRVERAKRDQIKRGNDDALDPRKSERFRRRLARSAMDDVQTKTAENVAKLESRLAERGGRSVSHVPYQAVSQGLAEQSKIKAEAAKANAKFEAAVEDAVNQGVKEAEKSSAQAAEDATKLALKEQAKAAEKETAQAAEAAAARVAEKEAAEKAEKEAAKAAEKSATKSVLKEQAKNVAKKVGQGVVNTAKSAGNAALKANAAYDKAFDKIVEKGTEKINNSTVGKAYNKAAEKVAESKIGKGAAKVASQAAQKVATTTVGKAAGKVVAKTVGTAVGKSVLKKIPGVSAAAGAYFAYDRLKNGDWKGACGEMASGIAGCFPGLGTAASVAIDAGLAAKDIHQAVKESKNQTAQNKSNNQSQQKTSAKTAGTQTAQNKSTNTQQKKTAPKDLSKQIAQRTEQQLKDQKASQNSTQKTTQQTNVSANQIAQTQQNSRA